MWRRKGLGAPIADSRSGADARRGRRFDPVAVRNEGRGLVIDSCLLAERRVVPERGGVRHPERIVRRAEERLLAAEWGPVSLADLCAAAGVSQAALDLAFQHLYGEAHLRYLHERRLMRARSILMEAKTAAASAAPSPTP